MSEQQILNEIHSLKTMLTGPLGRWLNLKEAVDYSRKGRYALLNLVAEGKVKACKDGDGKTCGWIFDRFSIDAWREGQCVSDNSAQKARDILSKIK